MVEWKKLGDIAKCYAGATPSTKNASYWEGGIIPWMSSGEVHQGIVTYTAAHITQLGYDNSSTKMLPKGSVVIALAGQGKTRGSVAITDIELCTNQSLCGIVLNKSNIINKYVYYFLGTRYNHLRKISSGEGTRGGLNLKMISDYEIPIPAISEQERIVGILDTFTSSIDNLKQQIAQRRKQYEYYRDQLLDLEGKEGVEMKTLGESCLIRTGSKPAEILDKGRYCYINAGTTESGYVNESNCDCDVVTTPSRGQGGIGFVGYQRNDFWLGPLCYQIRPNKKENFKSKYLFYYLSSHSEEILKYKSEGGTPAVNAVDLKKIQIHLPPLQEQQRIVSILDTFEASIQNLEAQLSQREKQYEYYRNKLLTFE